jgi:hypothetical protein
MNPPSSSISSASSWLTTPRLIDDELMSRRELLVDVEDASLEEDRWRVRQLAFVDTQVFEGRR